MSGTVVVDNSSDFAVTVLDGTVINVTVSGTGTQGPAGPASGGGVPVSITGDASIPAGQVISLINASADCVVTLPSISSAMSGGTSSPYLIVNLTAHQVTLLAAGSDVLNLGAAVVMRFLKEALYLLPTSQGWIIV